MAKMRIGIIGTGNISYAHQKSYKDHGTRCEVVAAADPLKKAQKKAAEEYGIPNIFSSHKDMLKKMDLDAVSVCAPNALHAPLTLDALRAGCNVLTEKPMATSGRDCDRMVAEAKKRRRVLMVGMTNRFSAAHKIVKDYADSGSLGDIYHGRVEITRRRGIPRMGSWFTLKEMSGGGGLIDIGVHALDLAWWLMGNPKPVAVSGATYMKFGQARKKYVYVDMWGEPEPGLKFDVDDYATALVRFSGGATLALEASWAVNGPEQSMLILNGDKGGVKLGFGGQPVIYTEDRNRLVDIEPKFKNNNWWADEVGHFLDCCETRKKPMCSGEHGATICKILDGIYKSSDLGREVKVAG